MSSQIVDNYLLESLLPNRDERVALAYRASHRDSGQRVILKIFHPQVAAQPVVRNLVEQSRRALIALDHTNIVRVRNVVISPAHTYFVTDDLGDQTLRDVLNRQLNLQQALDIGIILADALNYAYTRGFYHFNLQPETILVRGTEPFIDNFGLAGIAHAAGIPDKRIISLYYRAPEQLRGQRVEGQADIYALGCILYELVTGVPPFESLQSLIQAERAHTSQVPRPPSQIRPNLPPQLDMIILRCLEKSPTNRFYTPEDVKQALRQLGGERLIPASVAMTMAQSRSAQAANLATTYESGSKYAIPPEFASAPIADHARVIIYLHTGVIDREEPLTKEVTYIGRDPKQNAIVLNGENISRRHARIDVENGRWSIMDVGAANGIWRDAQRLEPQVKYRWFSGQRIRIGEYWLELQTSENHAARNNTPLQSSVVHATFDARRDSSRIEVIGLSQEPIIATPGEKTDLEFTIENRNDPSAPPDAYAIEIDGLPRDWYTLPKDTLYLPGQRRDKVNMMFHPPQSSPYGTYEFYLVIRIYPTTRSYDPTALDFERHRMQIQVGTRSGLTAELQPEQFLSTQAALLRVTNNGNQVEQVEITLFRPGEDEFRVAVDRNALTLNPKQWADVNVYVEQGRRSLIGFSKIYPFQVRIAGKSRPNDLLILTGEAISSPVIPIWTVLLPLVAMFCCLLAIGGYIAGDGIYNALFDRNGAVTDTPTPEILIPSATPAPTEAAPDSVLSQEAIPTQLPVGLDTDGDGLTDIEEIQVHKTSPTNRDTDGDTLSDGAEVQLSTDPLEPDTDGDGIIDALDPAPLEPPTPAPAPATAEVIPTATAASTLTPAIPTASLTPAPPPLPALSIDDPAAVAENSGVVVFTITLSAASAQPVSVAFSIMGMTASNTDFVLNSQSASPLTFSPGELSKNILVNITDDAEPEGEETFQIMLSNPQGAVIAKAAGFGRIQDNDTVIAPPPASYQISIANAVTVQENAGPLVFPVTVNPAVQAGQTIIVTYTLTPTSGDEDSRTPGVDYVIPPLQVAIGPGATSTNILITILDDADDEDDFTLSVTLNSTSAGTLSSAITAQGIVEDNDCFPPIACDIEVPDFP